MKRYWIERVLYPFGSDGMPECQAHKNYTEKNEALNDFDSLVEQRENIDTSICLYECCTETETDILIKQA